MKKIHIVFILMFLLSSCASGSYILTGQRKDPINSAQVELYTSPPAKYDVIGIVKASSEAGWTQQDNVNYALSKLKELAAELGANGILLTVTGETTSSTIAGYSNGYVYGVSSTAQTVTGQAIFVLEK